MITDDTYRCTRCEDLYLAHWFDMDADLCLSCVASREGLCFTPGHPDHDSPCSGPQEKAEIGRAHV